MATERLSTALGIAIVLALPGTAGAAGYGSVLALSAPSGSSAKGVRAGPFTVFPSLGLGAVYDTNYLRTPTDELSTWSYVARPGLKARAQKGTDEYNLAYQATIASVSADSDYDYVDHKLGADAQWELGLRHRLSGEYQFQIGNDRPGTADPDASSRPNFRDEPDQWRLNQLGGTYSYGAPGARGRLDLKAQQSWRRYENNDQGGRDYDQTALAATFYARVRPKTSLVMEVGNTHVDYTDGDGDSLGYADQNQPRAYLGVTWEATAKTTGTAKVGYLAVDFEDSAYSDWSGIGWDIGVTWQPRTYSTLKLETSRTPQQSGELGDAGAIVSELTLDWTHAWSSRGTTRTPSRCAHTTAFSWRRRAPCSRRRAGRCSSPVSTRASRRRPRCSGCCRFSRASPSGGFVRRPAPGPIRVAERARLPQE